MAEFYLSQNPGKITSNTRRSSRGHGSCRRTERITARRVSRVETPAQCKYKGNLYLDNKTEFVLHEMFKQSVIFVLTFDKKFDNILISSY